MFFVNYEKMSLKNIMNDNDIHCIFYKIQVYQNISSIKDIYISLTQNPSIV